MDKELLLKYKEQNPEKFAQKFGHLDLEKLETTETATDVVVKEKKEAVEPSSENQETTE